MRRVIVLGVGGPVLVIGVALIILPGPAFVVIPVGLAILALEFAWARRLLGHVRRGTRTVLGRKTGPASAPSSGPPRRSEPASQ